MSNTTPDIFIPTESCLGATALQVDIDFQVRQVRGRRWGYDLWKMYYMPIDSWKQLRCRTHSYIIVTLWRRFGSYSPRAVKTVLKDFFVGDNWNNCVPKFVSEILEK